MGWISPAPLHAWCKDLQRCAPLWQSTINNYYDSWASFSFSNSVKIWLEATWYLQRSCISSLWKNSQLASSLLSVAAGLLLCNVYSFVVCACFVFCTTLMSCAVCVALLYVELSRTNEGSLDHGRKNHGSKGGSSPPNFKGRGRGWAPLKIIVESRSKYTFLTVYGLTHVLIQ